MRTPLCFLILGYMFGGSGAIAGVAYNPRTLVFDDGGITSLAWSLDGKYIAACAMGGACRVWDASSGTALATAPGIGPTEQQTDAIGFTLDGRSILMPVEGGILVWDWSLGQTARKIAFPPELAQAGTGQDAFHRCGRQHVLVETTGDQNHNWALTLDDRDFHVRQVTPLPAFGLDPTCLPDALAMVAPVDGSDPGSVISLSDGHVIRKLLPKFNEKPYDPYMSITAVAAAPDGKLIAMGAELEDDVKQPDGSFVRVQAPAAVRLLSWPADTDIAGLFADTYVFTLSFSPDSRFLAAALDQQVGVEELDPPEQPRALTAPSDGFSPVAFSPVQNVLAVGRGAGVLLFDMAKVFNH